MMLNAACRFPAPELFWGLLVVALGLWPQATLADQGVKSIFGYVEWVGISEHGIKVKARLDTGARNSSLDARNVQRFRRGDKRYVRFDVKDPDSGDFVTLERSLVRIARIRQHDGPPQRRPVVMMWVCIGHLMQRVEVNLTERSDFLYPMLIGRSAMRGILVDPDLSLTVRPSCNLAEFIE